jgi:hypothetical protein
LHRSKKFVRACNNLSLALGDKEVHSVQILNHTAVLCNGKVDSSLKGGSGARHGNIIDIDAMCDAVVRRPQASRDKHKEQIQFEFRGRVGGPRCDPAGRLDQLSCKVALT